MGSGVELKPLLKIGRIHIKEILNSKSEIRNKHECSKSECPKQESLEF